MASTRAFSAAKLALLESYVHGYIAAPDVAHELTVRINASSHAPNSVEYVRRQVVELWATFFALAKELPHDDEGQDKLATLLNVIGFVPPPTHLNIPNWTSRHGAFWYKYPCLWETLMAIELTEGLLRTSERSSNANAMTRKQWTSLNVFVARFAEGSDLRLDLSLGTKMYNFVLDYEGPDAVKLDDNVPAAAAWFVFAKHKMFSGIMQLAGGQDKWASLRQRFEELGSDGNVEQETREWAMKAVVGIDSARLSLFSSGDGREGAVLSS